VHLWLGSCDICAAISGDRKHLPVLVRFSMLLCMISLPKEQPVSGAQPWRRWERGFAAASVSVSAVSCCGFLNADE
jgi:hypothetical protein